MEETVILSNQIPSLPAIGRTRRRHSCVDVHHHRLCPRQHLEEHCTSAWVSESVVMSATVLAVMRVAVGGSRRQCSWQCRCQGGVGENVGVGIGVGIGVGVGDSVRFLGHDILYRSLMDGCNADARLTSYCNPEVMLNYMKLSRCCKRQNIEAIIT